MNTFEDYFCLLIRESRKHQARQASDAESEYENDDDEEEEDKMLRRAFGNTSSTFRKEIESSVYIEDPAVLERIYQKAMMFTENAPEPEPLASITEATTKRKLSRPFASYFNPLFRVWIDSVLRNRWGSMERFAWTEFYSWAIPTYPLLLRMLELSGGKILEIGSGTGYWAALLNAVGVQVIATDLATENKNRIGRYYPVQIIDEKEAIIRNDPSYALFMCWPRYSAGIDYYRGDTIMFIGEVGGGCTFDIEYWLDIDDHKSQWEIHEEVQIPSWEGIRDVFICLKRKAG